MAEERGAEGAPGMTVRERLATIAHRDDAAELRIEIQDFTNGPPVIALRVWDRPAGVDVPCQSRGIALRADELAEVISALARALDWFRQEERRARRRLERDHGWRPAARPSIPRGTQRDPAVAR